jgi:hypothetical protein
MVDTQDTAPAITYAGTQSCCYAVPNLDHRGRPDASAFARNVK